MVAAVDMTATDAPASTSSADAIRCDGVSKRYGPTLVVDHVDLRVAPGEIHALVGANGAGKSTLLGILSGRTAPSAGRVSIFGAPLHFGQPRASRAAGVATVYQELTIIPQLSASANVFLGDERRHLGLLSESAMREDFQRLEQDFEVTIKPDAPAASLPVATLQLLEIMRAIERRARILLLDEPTAALSVTERDHLFALMRRLSARGVTIVFISHSLGEVLAVSHTITVMRNGHKVDTRPATGRSQSSLVRAMTGDAPLEFMRAPAVAFGEVVLEAADITLPGALYGVGLSVRAGEIVGLAGLVGAGRTSVLRSLAGAEPKATGRLRIKGRPRPWPRSPRRAISNYGIALLPEERKSQGLLLHRDVADNVTVADFNTVKRGIFVNARLQRRKATSLLTRLKLNRAIGKYPVRELSGGNQQKVVVAKWLHRDPQVLLVDEPTRGIDVAAKVEVLRSIREFAQQGKAVIVTSSELEEVLDISDRVVVLAQGRVVTELNLHEVEPSVHDLLVLCFGLEDE